VTAKPHTEAWGVGSGMTSPRLHVDRLTPADDVAVSDVMLVGWVWEPRQRRMLPEQIARILGIGPEGGSARLASSRFDQAGSDSAERVRAGRWEKPGLEPWARPQQRVLPGGDRPGRGRRRRDRRLGQCLESGYRPPSIRVIAVLAGSPADCMICLIGAYCMHGPDDD